MKLLVWLSALIACGLGSAAAERWPQPAAGESASGGPEVVFTFDDGPNPRTTPQILDELARRKIQAVFFLTGKMVGNRNRHVPALIRRIVREGHVIASHTMDHKDLCRVAELEAVADVDAGRTAIEQAAGVPTAWFRAPYGARCEQLERMLAERHLVHFHWDLDPQEWKHRDARRIVRYVTRELARRPGRNVLLLHDIKPATVHALPQILDWIDAENARRARAREPTIQIVQAPALAAEQLPRGAAAWLGDATACARTLPAAIASVLP